MKKGLSLLFGLLAIVGCKDDDDKAKPATEDQMKEVSGNWVAEVPISGETENWRTEEEGDLRQHLGAYLPQRCLPRCLLLGIPFHARWRYGQFRWFRPPRRASQL